MKNKFSTSIKDNVAAVTVLTVTFIAILGGIVTSNDARADKTSQATVQKMDVQLMETMFITAPRIQSIVVMETMLVTASRGTAETAKIMVASK